MENNRFMQRAIELAVQNVENNGGPFGAVIVKNDTIIAEGTNRVSANNDPTAHAEMMAIREACKKLNTFDLKGCEIYASCEPCPMCFSAIYWARLDCVYYAANHNHAAWAGFDDAFIYDEIQLEIEKRKIRFIEIPHPKRESPFDKWKLFEGRVDY
jgi:tRNA(Arg) A34 adenosine deaminase TadA